MVVTGLDARYHGLLLWHAPVVRAVLGRDHRCRLAMEHILVQLPRHLHLTVIVCLVSGGCVTFATLHCVILLGVVLRLTVFGNGVLHEACAMVGSWLALVASRSSLIVLLLA